ncbi:hypothetical protein CGRA01v4_05275 [Colletotrichum graminicola]|nr:hypothetical protein CGRA01v4_05275 [Colletotrichum graminicola]
MARYEVRWAVSGCVSDGLQGSWGGNNKTLHPLDETARRRDGETRPAALSPTGWASTAAPSSAIGSLPVVDTQSPRMPPKT